MYVCVYIVFIEQVLSMCACVCRERVRDSMVIIPEGIFKASSLPSLMSGLEAEIFKSLFNI